MKRHRYSTADRVRIFEAHGGVCEFCSGRIEVGQGWDLSHSIPLELGGADDESNLKPAHRRCHRDYTAKVDQPAIAKAKRRKAAHIGAKEKKPWHPTLRRKLNGKVVPK